MRMTAPIRPSSTAVMLLFADVAETHWCGENQLSSAFGAYECSQIYLFARIGARRCA